MNRTRGARLWCLALVSLFFATASGGAGAIWTTRGDCGEEKQDVNHFRVGETVYLNGAHFEPGVTYHWEIVGRPGQASADPGQAVASGDLTVNAAGAFCFAAYVVQPDDDGEYQVKFGNKGDNYRVEGAKPKPTHTPVPTHTPRPTPTTGPTSAPTATRPSTATPTQTLTATPLPSTKTPSATATQTPTAAPTATLALGVTPTPTAPPGPTATSPAPATATTVFLPAATPMGEPAPPRAPPPPPLPLPPTLAPPVVVVFPPALPPPPAGKPYCGLQVVNATESKRVELVLSWRNATAVTGTWGDGQLITGLAAPKNTALLTHQYDGSQQVAMIVVLVAKGDDSRTCGVNIFFNPQKASTPTGTSRAAPVCLADPPPPCSTRDGPAQQTNEQTVNVTVEGNGQGRPHWPSLILLSWLGLLALVVGLVVISWLWAIRRT